MKLSGDDVTRLMSDPSPATRATLAEKVVNSLESGAIGQDERRIAEDIFRLMARDASQAVREALSINLKSFKELPRDVALMLAGDVNEVATPILQFSASLSDADLIELVGGSSEAKQTAMAQRSTLSGPVADALVDTGNIAVVETVVGNDGAELSEATLSGVIDKFGDSPSIQEPLVQRSTLPLTISERLVSFVSDRLKDYLLKNHELSPDTASELVLRVRERATVQLLPGDAAPEDVDKLTAQLYRNDRLTPSLVLRTLCTGDMMFFESAMAVLADVPVTNARMLIHDSGKLGMERLYERAGLPVALFPAVRAALDIADQTDYRSADYDRNSYSRTVIERMLTNMEDLRPEDADYLLRRLDDLIVPSAAA